MWAVTGWAVATWLKISLALAVGVGAAWVWCSPGWFVVCVTLAALGSVFPLVAQVTSLGMAGLGILALLVVALRLLVRFVRERLEDAADARIAAAWRAAHAPQHHIPVGVS